MGTKSTVITNKNINIKCYIALTRFIESHDNMQFLNDLKEIETILIDGRKTEKTLWFRFFDGDLVNDYSSISFALSQKHKGNRFNYVYFIECIETALNNCTLQVHFN